MAHWPLITIGTAVALLICAWLLESRRPRSAAGRTAATARSVRTGPGFAARRRVALGAAAAAACLAMAANLIPDAHVRPIGVMALLGVASLLLLEVLVRRDARSVAAAALGLLTANASVHLVSPISRSAGGLINADGQPPGWLAMLIFAGTASLAITLLIHLARRSLRGLTLTRTLTFWSAGVGIALLLAAGRPITSFLTVNTLLSLCLIGCAISLILRPARLRADWLLNGLVLVLLATTGMGDARRLQLAADWAAPPNPIYAASKATPEQVYAAHAVVLDSHTAVLIVPNVYADGRGDRFGRHIDLLRLQGGDRPWLKVGAILEPSVESGDLINSQDISLSVVPTAGFPDAPASQVRGRSLRNSPEGQRFLNNRDVYPIFAALALLLWPSPWRHDHPEPRIRTARRFLAAAAFAALFLLLVVLLILSQPL